MNPAIPAALARFLVPERVAIVTGGAQGIGLAAARALHDAGAEVKTFSSCDSLRPSFATLVCFCAALTWFTTKP